MTLANSTRSNKVWDAPHSPYYVGRTIAVLDGTTLTIEAGVTVVFEENVGLVVRGRLEVVGAASAGVTLTLYRNETHAGSSDAWWTGVSLPVAGASVLLRYANITRAQAAVSGNQVIELENSIVSQNVQGVSGYRVTMKNSFVTQNVQGVSGDQVMVEHSIVAGNLRGLSCSHCALVNTTFEFNRQYGAEVLTGYVNESIARNNSVGYSTKSTFSITRNTIEDNDIGVSAGSYVTFLTNSIVRRNRIGISGSGLREMSGNQITDNREAGVSLSGSGIYFMNNTISGSPVCLSANGGVVRDSVFDNCSTVAFDGSATFECNIVRNCGEGIRNRQAVTGNLFENNKGPAITILSQLNAHNNTFINNGLHDVVQTTSALCDFSCNYWGTTDGDAVSERIIEFSENPLLGSVAMLPLYESSLTVVFCSLRSVTATAYLTTSAPATTLFRSSTPYPTTSIAAHSSSSSPISNPPVQYTSSILVSTAQISTARSTTTNHATIVAKTTTPVPQCDCHHGYAAFGCHCVCYAPFGGKDCSTCSTVGYVLDKTGSCVECVRPFNGTIAVLSGSIFTIPVQRSMPGCAVAVAVELLRSGTMPIFIAFSPTDSNVTFSMTCATSERAYIYFNRTMLFAQILCKAPVEWKRQHVPDSLHLHFMNRLAVHALRLAGGLGQTGATITVTQPGAPPSTFAASNLKMLVSAVNQMLSVEQACVAPTVATGPAPTYLFVFGDESVCTAPQRVLLSKALSSAAVNGAEIMWLGNSSSFSRIVKQHPTQYDEADAQLSEYLESFLMKTKKVNCTSELSFYPKAAQELRRVRLYLDGTCGVTRCCIGKSCSTFASMENRRPYCDLPLIPKSAKDLFLHVLESDGTWKTAAEPLMLSDVISSFDAVFENIDTAANRRADYTAIVNSGTVVVNRLESWNTESVASSCCALVAVDFNFTVLGAVGREVCFADTTTGKLPLPTESSNAFSSLPMLLAAQCYQPATLPTAADFDDELDSDLNVGVFPGMSNPAPFTAAAPRYGSGSVSRTTKIEQYVRAIEIIADNRAVAGGHAVTAVRWALAAANLKTTLNGEQRACQPAEETYPDGTCRFEWSAAAKDAGSYLESMGFGAVATDWYLTGAELGDIAVFPSCTVCGPNSLPDRYELGHVAVKTTNGTSADARWVSDFVHTKSIIHFLYDALLGTGGSNISCDSRPMLYRLPWDAEVVEAFRSAEEIVPVQGVEQVVDKTLEWMQEWARKDKQLYPPENFTATLLDLNVRFACPIVISMPWPQQLVEIEMTAEMARNAFYCLEMTGIPLQPLGVRCCYNVYRKYIPAWPSRVSLATALNWQWSTLLERAAETIGCERSKKASAACAVFTSRRPPARGTNTPFAESSDWQPVRRSGGAFGDPHCLTYDGVQYECNFCGEAKWTVCGDWRVHVSAEAVGTGAATVIRRLAVREGTETVVVLLGGSVYFNEQTVTSNRVGKVFSVMFVNGTVVIRDANGNTVTAQFFPSMLVVSTSPGEGCFNKTTGLCGNNNGDPSDDFSIAGGAVLTVNSSQSDIFSGFVVTHLVTSCTDTLFPLDSFVAGNTSYMPSFANASGLTSCPAVCRGVLSCCFDAAVGGPQFADQYNAAAASLVDANANAMTFTAKWPPQFEVAPDTVTVQDGSLAAQYVIVASSPLKSITCDLCSVALVLCRTSGLGTNYSTLAVTGRNGAAFPNEYECTAVDSEGLQAVASTIVVKTPSETSAPKDSSSTKLALGLGVGLGLLLLLLSAIAAAIVYIQRRRSLARELKPELIVSKKRGEDGGDSSRNVLVPPFSAFQNEEREKV